ncbi:1-acyl-sn-glycerol-3-phosphate acyltransferase [Pseudomonas sp. LS44]|uniref:lysophospholipid acyltransferase family protein n=1 Tax=Pseudomonas sp. LS44 TaxID=1357074 RepID=UPI00215AAEE4|nr:lysophospholipid acyltransferase family protein [Pseudomonas sp. LS44]UVE18665.1 1-acyl-sn-glycerol-3-phosphate acyltransferase [Pseudomonas sp. LS44]
MNLATRLRRYARIARLLATLGLGIGLAGCAAALERFGYRQLATWRGRWCRRYLVLLSKALPFRVEMHGQVPTTPMLWVSNHVSWTDIPLLGMLAPLAFVSKAEVRHWPLAGWFAQQAGTLFIRRGAGDSTMLQHSMGECLRGGRALLLFPEGTSTDGRALRTFHGRLLGCAIDSGVAVQPVAISYHRGGQADHTIAPFVGNDDLLSHLLRLFAEPRLEVRIELLTPLASHGVQRAELARQAQLAVHTALFGAAQSQPLAA